MISVEDAQARCLALITPLPSETLPLRLAAGRMMAAPARASRDQPPFDASAMDGYAISTTPPEAPPAPGQVFTVTGEAQAGRGHAGDLGPGEAIRIFTGAPIPQGATRVVLQEDVTREDHRITIGPKPDLARHIRPRGQDFKAGDSLGPRLLSAHDLALLAAMNIPRVEVARRPSVALLATGDELVMPGDCPAPDQIICSNVFALAALAEAQGATARILPIARDKTEELTAALRLAAQSDLIVTIGGASVGDHDLVGPVAESLGLERAFWKIAMRPGKPLLAGRVLGKPMLGLPGNPVSSIVCAHLFLLPMLRALQGRPDVLPQVLEARLAEDMAPTGPRTHYMRARLEAGEIRAFARQDSALLQVLTEANALLIRPRDDGPRQRGETCLCLPL